MVNKEKTEEENKDGVGHGNTIQTSRVFQEL